MVWTEKIRFNRQRLRASIRGRVACTERMAPAVDGELANERDPGDWVLLIAA
jgi:hypothetical protein